MRCSLDRRRSPASTTENRKEVEVECEGGALVTPVTYFPIKPEEQDKRPSGVYMDVIVRGAEAHGIPPASSLHRQTPEGGRQLFQGRG